ncbi:MAG: virulence protein, partial [Candidatus Delongbacteria bacterium]|nr:virulence protein [Candidatus Delongbacteria bacterium]MDD4205677.1 virulence protein [Candidatus Delongbacteria bacterium]
MKKNEIANSNMNKGQFLVYEAENGKLKIDVRLQDETVWLTQKAMAELFQVKPQNITMHLK